MEFLKQFKILRQISEILLEEFLKELIRERFHERVSGVIPKEIREKISARNFARISY